MTTTEFARVCFIVGLAQIPILISALTPIVSYALTPKEQ